MLPFKSQIRSILRKNGTTIITPELEKQENGKVDTHVTSKIVNTDDKDHEIVADYQIIEHGGQAVSDLVRTASQVLKLINQLA